MATQLNDWLTIDNASGTGNAQITLTASSYEELVDRTASLKIQGINTNAILNVRQKAYSPVPKNNDYFWIEFENTNSWLGGLGEEWTDIYYSFDAETWTAVDSTGIVSLGTHKLVYLKNETKRLARDLYIDNSGTYVGEVTHISLNSNAKIGGDLSSMTDMDEWCCAHLFDGSMYLTDASALILPWDTLADGCYYFMFYNCMNLTAAPALPATTLARLCYSDMFYNCIHIETAPALPATTLASDCYSEMFRKCTRLTTAPALPVTTLADGCYAYMFANCTSLTTAPELLATTLVVACYYGMFYGCTSLETAPELPATTLAGSCYSSMFNDCTSLTTAPELPAFILVDRCYYGMFKNCTSLTTAPELPATILAYGCYLEMFQGCTNLNYIKMMAIDISASYCLDNWVNGVSSTGTFVKNINTNIPTGISGIPNGWVVINEEVEEEEEEPITDDYFWIKFENTGGEVFLTNKFVEDYPNEDATDLYYSFDTETWTPISGSGGTISMGTNTIVYIKNDSKRLVYRTKVGFTNYEYYQLNIQFNSNAKVGGDLSSMTDMIEYACTNLFDGNTYLTDASALILPWDTLSNNCYESMFYLCTNLEAAPELLATTLAEFCYRYMYEGCTSLETAPELPALILERGCYWSMFESCTSLTTAPELLATTLADYCYDFMFRYCTNLTNVQSVLPATTLTKYCYDSMFYGCTSLITAPELPATTLADGCYGSMFRNCTNLNYIKMLATDISAEDCLLNWVNGVSSTGTFVKHLNATLPTGTSGIPSGWDVQTAT